MEKIEPVTSKEKKMRFSSGFSITTLCARKRWSSLKERKFELRILRSAKRTLQGCTLLPACKKTKLQTSKIRAGNVRSRDER